MRVLLALSLLFSASAFGSSCNFNLKETPSERSQRRARARAAYDETNEQSSGAAFYQDHQQGRGDYGNVDGNGGRHADDHSY